jgi:hypothetical protein
MKLILIFFSETPGIPTLKVEVDEIQVKEGSNTRLQCQIIPSSQTALVSDIKWFLNIQPLHSKTG